MTPQEAARDKRLRKTYGWTLEMVEALSEAQGHRCAACGREKKVMPLNVDHIHFRVMSAKIADGNWYAWTEFDGMRFDSVQRFKKDAVSTVKLRAMPYSVRGLLCAGRYAGCNRKLGRIDDPVWLRRCADYLEKWPSRQVFPAKIA